MPINKVNKGDLITSSAWNSIVDEINLKANRTGDFFSGAVTITTLGTGKLTVDSLIVTNPVPRLTVDNLTVSNVVPSLTVNSLTVTNKMGSLTVATAAVDTLTVTNKMSSLTVATAAVDTLTVTNKMSSLSVTTAAVDNLTVANATKTGMLIVDNLTINTALTVNNATVSNLAMMYGYGEKITLGNMAAIGTKDSIVYFRSPGYFHWYFKGRYQPNDSTDPGEGGRWAMLLNDVGNLYIKGKLFTESSYSDAILKKNVQKLENALDKLTQLRGVTFEWKNPENHSNSERVQTGWIAQEVEKVFPDWIHEHNELKNIIPTGFEFQALVVEALKELKQRIVKLEQR